MIITKTPYRISFFGGGSDYPSWYEKNGGAVLSTTIDKFLYISCRFSPKYFKKKYRIVWRKIENVQRINQINHNVVRELLKYLKIKPGLEIHYYGDLPARSGMGSSSCFTVGLMQSLYKIKKINLNKLDLAKKSIYFEQNVKKEIVGSQDQVVASIGGFNKIIFNKNKSIRIKKIKRNKNIESLENNLVLIYTRINRTAHKIASSYVNKLTTTKKNYIKNILEHVHEGEKILTSGNIDDFGKLLNSSWTLKKKLSVSISNRQIDDLYNQAIYNGALGGKLLGAGGGGFLLMYMKKKYRDNFFKRYPKIINVPFKFSNVGTEVIFKDLNR